MRKFFSFLMLFSFALTISMYGQYVRRVIVEEATNASCGPCAAQNPTFQQWLSNHLDRVIPVIYHAWWPGSNDPMYRYDTNMNRTRIIYYGINGVPSGRVNGKIAPPSSGYYAGAVADTNALNNQLNQESFYSLIGIKFTIFDVNTNDGSGSVKVEIQTDVPIKNKYLRIAICEEHHYYASAGNNGEKDFYYLARKMLPDATGTILNMEAGETQSFSFNFNVDPSFTDDLYAVAFIQDDATKEILQGNWTKNSPIKEPDYFVIITNPQLIEIGNTGDSYQLDAYVLNNTPAAIDFDVEADIVGSIPSDWTTEIVNGTQNITVQPNSKEKVSLAVQVGSTPYAAEVGLKFKNTAKNIYMNSATLRVYHSGIQRLHVLAGEEQHSIMPIIKTTLGDNYIFDISLLDFAANASKFNSLKTIVWNGSTNGEFTTPSANIITDALSNNKNIFILGGHFNPGMTSTGMLPYFGIAFIAYCREGYGTAPYPVKLAGVPGDPITGDFGTNIQGYLIKYLLPLYRIVNKQTTTPIMTFAKSADSICAVKVQFVSSRAIVLGMNPYIIADPTIRQKLITRSLQWLEGITSVEDEVHLSNVSIAPNPATSFAYLHLTSDKYFENVVVRIVDNTGRILQTAYKGSLSQGSNTIPILLTGLPNQQLWVVVESNGSTQAIPLIKIE